MKLGTIEHKNEQLPHLKISVSYTYNNTKKCMHHLYKNTEEYYKILI